MKIAYVTTYDGLDIRNWSGTAYFMGQTINNISGSCEFIGNFKDGGSLLYFRLKNRLYNLFDRTYHKDREPYIMKYIASQLSEKLENSKSDIIFSPGTIPISYLDSKKPIVFWTDATFNAMIDFYPTFSKLCNETIKHGHIAEKLALEKCKLAIFSSDWAAKSAINYYKVKPEKVKVIPFGANIVCTRELDDIKSIVKSRSKDICKLLFLGVDWERKGGDIALEVVKKLNEGGIKAELTIVGCDPQTTEPLPKFVNTLGYISKASKEGANKINKLLEESHFLIVPSKAECYGIVFCEANSYGVPCIATDVGGIPTIIKDGINGKTFSKDSLISEYSLYISELFNKYDEYKSLALSSFNEYGARLNWSVSGQKIKKLLEQVV